MIDMTIKINKIITSNIVYNLKNIIHQFIICLLKKDVTCYNIDGENNE